MILTDEQGKNWEYRGYWPPSSSNYFYPVMKVYKFGGVRFRETGEVRSVSSGEWALINDQPVYWLGPTSNLSYPILEPMPELTV